MLGSDIRLAYTKLIDPVPDGLKCLIHRHFHNTGLRPGEQRQLKRWVVAFPCNRNLIKIRIIGLCHFFENVFVLWPHKGQGDPIISKTLQFNIPDFTLTQIAFYFLHNPLQVAFHGLLGSHFQNEVHTPLEVKTETNLVSGQDIRPPSGKVTGERRHQIYE